MLNKYPLWKYAQILEQARHELPSSTPSLSVHEEVADYPAKPRKAP